MPKKLSIRVKLVKQAVHKLKKFGFKNVNEENILSDEVYSLYFFKILNEMLGEDKGADPVIDQLLQELKMKDQKFPHKEQK